jgi:hypothetical protein
MLTASECAGYPPARLTACRLPARLKCIVANVCSNIICFGTAVAAIDMAKISTAAAAQAQTTRVAFELNPSILPSMTVVTSTHMRT